MRYGTSAITGINSTTDRLPGNAFVAASKEFTAKSIMAAVLTVPSAWIEKQTPTSRPIPATTCQELQCENRTNRKAINGVLSTFCLLPRQKIPFTIALVPRCERARWRQYVYQPTFHQPTGNDLKAGQRASQRR